MQFDRQIGIDYSGRGKTTTRTAAIQVYVCDAGSTEPQSISSPASTGKSKRNWCRRELAEWLVDQLGSDLRVVIGIDHGFSMPRSYFQRYHLSSWDAFLDDFCQHWPTHQDDVEVDTIRGPRGKRKTKLTRTGSTNEFRVTEQWTSSAKSVFQFDMQGSVAKSTHAGIPWLQHLRKAHPKQLHFWPFDGWKPTRKKSVIAEVYPSIFRNRYPRKDRTVDQQDAYCVAKWLATADQQGILPRYFDPPLSQEERTLAELEGWILGIS